jgi:hypothetical protein
MFEVFRRDPGPRFLLAQPVGAMGVFFPSLASTPSSHLATLFVLAPDRRLIKNARCSGIQGNEALRLLGWMVCSCSEGGW